ncbi:MAG: hypothetical protein C5B49_12300 [Bdellovibrio sp.]|nr:MAG: hypothetical protein C5B49_12300 [Bdellovibrio sp.]
MTAGGRRLQLLDASTKGEAPDTENDKAGIGKQGKQCRLRNQMPRHFGFLGKSADHVKTTIGKGRKHHRSEKSGGSG